MPASYTYTTLKAALISFTEDTGTEFAAAIDLIIPLAETQLLRDMDIEIFDTVTSLNFTAANPILAKPTDIVATRSLHYTNAGGEQIQLDPKSWEYIKDYWPIVTTTTSNPKYYTEYSPTEWYIAGTPSGTNTVTARCIVRPTGLTSVNNTTWLGTNVGDLLFYSCLAIAEEFLKADARIPLWKQEYVTRLRSMQKEFKLEDRSNYKPISTIATTATTENR